MVARRQFLLPIIVLALAAAIVRAEPPAAAPAGEPVGNGSSSSGSGLTPAAIRSWHGNHPRLLFTAADLDRLHGRRALHTKSYNLLLKRADDDMSIMPGDIGKHRGRLPTALPRLALAGIMSGDRRYTNRAIGLLLAQLEDSTPLSDVYMARLMSALALTYDWTYQAMTAQQRRDAARRMAGIAAQFNHLMTRRDSVLGQLQHLPHVAGHHRLAEAAGGLGLLVLALRGEANLDIITAGTATCDSAARSYLLQAFGADGAGIEGFDATMDALTALLPYVLARRKMDNVDLAEGSAVGMTSAWGVYELTAGPAMMPLGESGRDPLSAASGLALLTPLSRDAGLHRWFSDQIFGDEGWKRLEEADYDAAADIWHMLYGDLQTDPRPPEAVLPLVKFFPSRGIGYARSGWLGEGGDTIISFHVPSQPHLGKWQLDVNQFTYEAFGTGWAIDSGPARQAARERETPALRAHSEGHNLMEIDATGQTLPLGRMIAFHDESDWLVAIGDGSESYGTGTFRRSLIAGKRDGRVRYLIIADEVDVGDDNQHVYRHFLHTAAGNRVTIEDRGATIAAPGGAVAQYALIFPADGVTFSVADFPPGEVSRHPRIESRHGRRGPFTMVSVLVADTVPPAALPESDGSAGPDASAAGGAKGKARAVINVDQRGPAVAFRLTVDGIEDRICILTQPDARPPFGYGSARHRLQLKSGQAAKTLLFDYSEPGHDSPDTPSTHSDRGE